MEISTFLISFYLSSLFLTPDLDTSSIPLKRWSYLCFVWKPFTHRGILHSPLFSPIILTIPVDILAVGLSEIINISWWIIPIYAGIFTQVELHILLDWVADRVKKEKSII